MASCARVLGRAAHPMLIVLPLGLLTMAVVFDVLAGTRDEPTFAVVAYWMIAAGVVGDAYGTTEQESAYAVSTQAPAKHGPPMCSTPDWASAKASVRALAAIEPDLVVIGHGRAMEGGGMREALHALASNSDEIAVPDQGRYVGAPARAEDGSAYRAPDA